MTAPDLALIAPYPPPGVRHGGASGVASYTGHLARALGDAGADVRVLAPMERGVPTVQRDGAVTVERRFRRGASALPVAAHAAAATGAPVVHVQHELFLYGGPTSMPSVAPALAELRARGRAAVVTMHHAVAAATVDPGFVRLHRVRAPTMAVRAGIRALNASIRHLAGAVIVHEPALAAAVPGARVVPHGIPDVVPPTRAAARRALGLDDERLTALCFGFLAPYKGLELAIEGALAAGRDVELVVAGGEHPRHADSRAYAAELRRRGGDRVRFTGPVPDAQVSQWFAAADVALLLYPRPFASSGPLALALAHGTPLLLSDALARCVGAPPEIGVALTAEAVGARLRELATHPGAAVSSSGASARLADQRAWPEVAARHLDLYREMIDADRPADRSRDRR